MTSQDGRGLIERRRAQSADADRRILTALDDAAPDPLTVPELARLALGTEGRQATRENRVRSRLSVLLVAGSVRQDKRRYYAVGAAGAPALDPHAQVLAEQRAQWMHDAERAGYQGRLGDLLVMLDGRAAPHGWHQAAAEARSILRNIQSAVGKGDLATFDRIKETWRDEINAIEILAERYSEDRELLREAESGRKQWIAANQAQADADARQVRRRLKRTEYEHDEILELIDRAPAQTWAGASLITVPSDVLDWCQTEGYIEIERVAQNAYLYRSGVNRNYTFLAAQKGFTLSPNVAIKWVDFLPFLHIVSDAFEDALYRCGQDLAAIAARRAIDPGRTNQLSAPHRLAIEG